LHKGKVYLWRQALQDENAPDRWGRGLVGGLLLGPIGLLAEAVGAQKSYRVEMYWTNGKKSLIEIREDVYDVLVKLLY